MKTASIDDVKIIVSDDGRILEINWSNFKSRYHSIWLRDNGQDDKTRNPSNHQKLITLQDIPIDCSISSASINSIGQVELTFLPDHWKTQIDLNWLKNNSYDQNFSKHPLVSEHVTIWDSGLEVPMADFAQAKKDPTILLQWLKDIDRFGVAIMSNTRGVGLFHWPG